MRDSFESSVDGNVGFPNGFSLGTSSDLSSGFIGCFLIGFSVSWLSLGSS